MWKAVYGDHLYHYDPVWVKRLAGGINRIFWFFVLAILLPITLLLSALIFGNTIAFQNAVVSLIFGFATKMCMVIFILMGVTGLWMLTSPEPDIDKQDKNIRVRKVIRLVAATLSVLGILPLLSEKYFELISDIIRYPILILGFVEILAVFIYLRRLALRIPHKSLAAKTMIVMWGLALTTLAHLFKRVMNSLMMYSAVVDREILKEITDKLEAAESFGYFIFGIWAISLFDQYHKQLNHAALAAAKTWARQSCVLHGHNTECKEQP